MINNKNNNCFNCGDRFVNVENKTRCHDTCLKYKGYRNEVNMARKKSREDDIFREYISSKLLSRQM